MTSGSVVPPRPYDPADPKPTTFPQVLRDEIDRVQSSRDKRGVATKDCANKLTGLAFSGGGIRSATFNLGILQALAEKGLLRRVRLPVNGFGWRLTLVRGWRRLSGD